MKKIFPAIMVLTVLFTGSVYAQSGEWQERLTELREQKEELRSQVDAGTITEEEAREQWEEIMEEARAEKEAYIEEREAEMQAYIEELREDNPELAEELEERLEQNAQKREEREQNRLENRQDRQVKRAEAREQDDAEKPSVAREESSVGAGGRQGSQMNGGQGQVGGDMFERLVEEGEITEEEAEEIEEAAEEIREQVEDGDITEEEARELIDEIMEGYGIEKRGGGPGGQGGPRNR